MRLNGIPDIMSVETHTFPAYMKSRGLLVPEAAMIELYEICYDTTALPAEVRRCNLDTNHWREHGVINIYVLKALEMVRRYQIELRARGP